MGHNAKRLLSLHKKKINTHRDKACAQKDNHGKRQQGHSPIHTSRRPWMKPSLQQWSPRWVHRVSIFQTIHLDLRGLAFLLRPQRQLTCLLIFPQIYSYGKPTLDQKHYILKAVITHKYYPLTPHGHSHLAKGFATSGLR